MHLNAIKYNLNQCEPNKYLTNQNLYLMMALSMINIDLDNN